MKNEVKKKMHDVERASVYQSHRESGVSTKIFVSRHKKLASVLLQGVNGGGDFIMSASNRFASELSNRSAAGP